MPPHACTLPNRITKSPDIQRDARHLLCLVDRPKIKQQANAAPPPRASQRFPGCRGYSNALRTGAVVEIVRIALPGFALVMLTVFVVPKLRMGGSTAPDGLLVTAALSVTVPVNP